MNHLTQEQLSGYVDGALAAAEHAEATAHLAGCEVCRAELETLRAADTLFGEVLSHDPGDAYFRTFASRVADRIAAEGAAHPAAAREVAVEAMDAARAAAPSTARSGRAGAPWWDISSWFASPARLAWVGGVAAVVVTAGVVLMMARESGVPDLRDAKLLERSTQREAGRAGPPPEAVAPPAASLESRLSPTVDADAAIEPNEEAPATVGRAEGDDAAGAPSTPARVREMRQLPGGEDVPVSRQDVPAFARPPAEPPPPSAPGEPVRVRRPQRAEPLTANEKEQKTGTKDELETPAVPVPAAKPDAQSAKRAASNLGPAGTAEGARAGLARELSQSAAPACGIVVDAKNRPVARAQVVLGDRGVTATTDADGRFCFDVVTGDYDLTVLAVGFTPLRRQVRLGDPGVPARLVAQTVEVLPPAPAAPRLDPFGGTGPAEVPPAPTDLPDSVSVMWNDARRLMDQASQEPSAARFEAAVETWNDVIAALPDGPADLEASEHRAHALYAAWSIEPTGGRAAAAATALREVAPRLPQGPRRDRARQMLARLQP